MNQPIKKEFPAPDISHLNEAKHFATLKDFFAEMLRNKIRYVVIRNWQDAEDESLLGPDSDLDILVQDDDLPLFNYAIRPITPNAAMHITLRLVRISDSYLKLDVRSPHDNYFPPQLAQKMIENRKKLKSFFIPSDQDYFWSLLYHCTFQKPHLKEKYKEILLGILPSDFPADKLTDRQYIWDRFEQNGWTPVEPYDEWVWWLYRDNSARYPEWSEYELPQK